MAQAQPQMSLFQTYSFDHKEPARPWKHGLFGCCGDIGGCCMAIWCPCMIYGQNMEKLGAGNNGCMMYCVFYTCFGGLGPMYLQWIGRGNVRNKLNIEGSSFGDCCTSCCCGTLALVQEKQEIDEAAKVGQL